MSGTDINVIVDKMLEHGVHGKLTGAGGEGGCVIGFYIPAGSGNQAADILGLKSELEALGYSVEADIGISATGLTFD